MSLTHDDPKPAGGPARWIPIAIIAVVAVVGGFTLRSFLSFEALAEHREALIAFRDTNYVLAVVTFVAAYVVIVAFSLPGAAVASLAGGFLFSTFPGAVYNVLAATIGATLIFLAVKAGFGDRLAARMDTTSGAVKALKSSIDENRWSVLFLMRLVPAVPFFAANLLPALVGVTLTQFAVTTFLGIIPGAVVYTSVGAGLGDIFARGEAPDLGIIFEPQILLPILGLCALAALPLVLKALRPGAGRA